MKSARSFLLFFLFTCAALFCLNPNSSSAMYEQANIQCPPGGKINQPCKDTTNGYTTQGKCAFVYVCKADNVGSKTPPTCKGGSRDCPTGMPYPQFTPTPKRFPTGTSSPIGGSSISEIEAGVLGAAFNKEGTQISNDVDLEDLSASANESLFAVLGATEEDGFLGYTPESFDAKTSSLFAALREGAVMLTPGGLPQDTAAGRKPPLRLAYATESGFFGGASDSGGGSEVDDAIQKVRALKASMADQFWLFPRYLALGVYNAARALGSLLLADFATAGKLWSEAVYDFGVAGYSLYMAFRLLVQFIIAWITAKIPTV